METTYPPIKEPVNSQVTLAKDTLRLVKTKAKQEGISRSRIINSLVATALAGTTVSEEVQRPRKTILRKAKK